MTTLAEFPVFNPYVTQHNYRRWIVQVTVFNPVDRQWYPVQMVYDTAAEATVFFGFSPFVQNSGIKDWPSQKEAWENRMATQGVIAGVPFEFEFTVHGAESGIGVQKTSKEFQKESEVSGMDGVLGAHVLAPYLDVIQKEDKLILKSKGEVSIPADAQYVPRKKAEAEFIGIPTFNLTIENPSTGLSKPVEFIVDTGAPRTIIGDMNVRAIGLAAPPGLTLESRVSTVHLKATLPNGHTFPMTARLRLTDIGAQATLGMIDLLPNFDILIIDPNGIYLVPKRFFAKSAFWLVAFVLVLVVVYFIFRKKR